MPGSAKYLSKFMSFDLGKESRRELQMVGTSMRLPRKHLLTEGKVYENVVLETYLNDNPCRPSVRPAACFQRDIRVEFPQKLHQEFPLGTYFRATIQVCQEHWPQTGKPKGLAYLVASNIYVHRTELTSGSKSGSTSEHRREKVS